MDYRGGLFIFIFFFRWKERILGRGDSLVIEEFLGLSKIGLS